MIRLLQGDCRAVLATLPARSVQMCVTSPPYFGLRDYETGTWEGGDPACGHVVGEMRRGLGLATSAASTRGGGHKAAETADIQARALCPHCGAARIDLQIGLEESPEAYVAELVAVFREVRRVLRDDGTLWLNLGDSYASRANGSLGKGSHLEGSTKGHAEFRRAHALRSRVGQSSNLSNGAGDLPRARMPAGLKHKDLIGIPWMVAFALRADGWWLRQEIIWHKTQPMPESVEDRCTKAHEHVFLLSKSATYYYDAEAIAEPTSPDTHARAKRGRKNPGTYPGGHTIAEGPPSAGRRPGVGPKAAAVDENVHGRVRANADFQARISQGIPTMRNKRSVWSLGSEGFPEAHFATYPTKLVEPCILAGSPKGGVVLDPFHGAGTTALVADRLGRDCIGIDLSSKYIDMQRRRLHKDAGLYLEVSE